MTEMRIVVHLVNGRKVAGNWSEVPDLKEIEDFKTVLVDMASNSGEWQINLQLTGSWVMIPKASILYISLENQYAEDTK